jgi:peptidyl-prolyl cis-trans isomerase SurA
LKQTTPAQAPGRRTQLIIASAIVVLGALGGGGYYYYTTQYVAGGPVAVVNGLKIARKEFNESVTMITQTASLQGANITDPAIQKEINNQAIDILVSNTLLLDGARAAGISTTKEAVQAEYDKLVTELGGQEALTARMAEVKLSEAKLRSNIEERLIVDQYLKAETDMEDVKVSEEDVKAAYDSYKGSGVDVPPYEDIKTQIETQLVGQKQQDIVNTFIATLKEKATIEIKI